MIFKEVNYMLRIAVLALVSVLLVATPALAQVQEQSNIEEQLSDLGYLYTSDSFIAAAKSNDLEAVELFLQAGMSPNAADPGKAPAIIYAAQQGYTAIVDTLVRHGALINSVDPTTGKTALYYAVEANFPEMAIFLLDYGADPNGSDRVGMTPLMMAARRGDTEMVRRLIAHGADANARDQYGDTAYSYAVTNGNVDIATVLQDWYAAHTPGPVLPIPRTSQRPRGSQVPFSVLRPPAGR
jgi:ankyrin repeat protein